MDVSDDDEPYLKKGRTKQLVKGGRNVNFRREAKLHAPSSRRKTGRTFEEYEEESSDEDSENGSFDDFSSTRGRAGTHRRKNVGRSATVNVSGRNSEPRTSNRSTRKVSYVESDDSEDADDKKKNQKVCLCY